MGCVTSKPEEDKSKRKVIPDLKMNASAGHHKVVSRLSHDGIAQEGVLPGIHQQIGTEPENSKTIRSSKTVEDGLQSKRQLLKKYSIKIKDSCQRTPTINSYQYETMLAHNPPIVEKCHKEGEWIETPLHPKLNLNKV